MAFNFRNLTVGDISAILASGAEIFAILDNVSKREVIDDGDNSERCAATEDIRALSDDPDVYKTSE